jgi:hypothetical protein
MRPLKTCEVYTRRSGHPEYDRPGRAALARRTPHEPRAGRHPVRGLTRGRGPEPQRTDEQRLGRQTATCGGRHHYHDGITAAVRTERGKHAQDRGGCMLPLLVRAELFPLSELASGEFRRAARRNFCERHHRRVGLRSPCR